ncbi:MAG: TonB-dependent receptor [Burkholderiales bacterium]|nr:TonB-dependent receptor [Burkholderiales bacterium]
MASRHPTPFRPRALALAVTAAFALPALADDKPAPNMEAPRVDVIGTTPLPGLGLSIQKFPGNVQSVTASDIRRSQQSNLPDLLTSQLQSVNVNDVQGNPYQPDLNYRGFTASPLLGLPQGLSVFQDGVRINEPFGDTVNWGLIPMNAISTINLIPGSNPLFGLNTLGGALSLRTKSGFQFPNTSIELSGGSWGRSQAQFEHGGYTGNKDYYIAGNWFREDGWRDFSPTDVKQFFAKTGVQTDDTDFDVSFTYARTDLIGNGVTPESFLNQNRNSIFTRPDNTRNTMAMVNFTGSHFLDAYRLISGNIYYRHNKTETLNGDVNDDFEGGPNDGETGANGGAGFNSETGVNNRTKTKGRTVGGTLQYSQNWDTNQLAVGTSYDDANADFEQTSGVGEFDSTRQVIQSAADVLGNSLNGKTRTASLFVTDTWTFMPNFHLTASARYNHTNVKNKDKLNSTPPNLDGDFTYVKVNPALGLNWTPSQTLTTYVSASQGNRAPSPIELGCADPNNPCTLPNALAADPFLKQVVARTYEIGARGLWGTNMRWNAALFQTNLNDDILFVSTTTSAGYFTNFGKTRRQGIELGMAADVGRTTISANYSLVDATYQSDATILAENNSSRGFGGVTADDEIRVRAGDRIPGIPQHQFRLNFDYRATDELSFGANIVAMTGNYARGNENNQHEPGTVTDPVSGDTRTFLGAGKTAAYAVLNLTARYRVAPRWEIFGRINNVFDTRFNTAAILAENPFNAGAFQTNSDLWARETFYGPGAPRAAWIGVRYFIERPPR